MSDVELFVSTIQGRMVCQAIVTKRVSVVGASWDVLCQGVSEEAVW